MATSTSLEGRRLTKPLLIAGCLVAAVAAYFLWEKHESHILGALFWLLLLACPAIHFFMHRNHGHAGHRGGDSAHAGQAERRTS